MAEPSFIVRTELPDPTKPPAPVMVTLLLLMLLSNVPVNVAMERDRMVIVPPKLSVTVPPPELPSSVTESPEPGTDAPGVPGPVGADQFVGLTAVHDAVQQIQNREAL